MIASTNGVAARNRVTDSYGVSTPWTTPITSPPVRVSHKDLSRPINAAAREEMTRKVRAE